MCERKEGRGGDSAATATAGSTLRRPDTMAAPPLFIASMDGDLEAVRSLLRARADVNALDPQSQLF